MKVRNQWNEIYDILKTVMPIENYASVRKKESSRNKGKGETQRTQSLAVGIVWEYCPRCAPEGRGTMYLQNFWDSECPMLLRYTFPCVGTQVVEHSLPGTLAVESQGPLMGTWPPLQVPGLRSEHQLRSGTWKNGHDLSNRVLYKENRFLWDLCKYMYWHEK